mmetsp:Transcript_112096/g.317477  ORF Transcript_112096/g.317477 Transcript_112096/m.317477 type:complete len:342 (-) Transcript_112096:65-1090(-)
MDDARKLLDSLMGSHRNSSIQEVQKRRGENFKDEGVCKFYLLGFCPMQEQLFHSTKRDLGDCTKVHSDAFREEFEKHPDRHKYQPRYEADFRAYLEGCVREADAWVSRERNNAQRSFQYLQERGDPEKNKEEVERLSRESSRLLELAESLAEAGDLEKSRETIALSEQAKQQAQEAETKTRRTAVQMEEVCEVCGVRTEAGDDARMSAHLQGKVHLGYMRIREALKALRDKQRQDGDDGRERDHRSRSRKRGRERSRSGSINRRKEVREKCTERNGEKEKEKGEKEKEKGKDREKHRDRDKDRDRDADKGKDKAREKHKDRDRDRDRERRRSRSKSRRKDR